LEQKLYKQALHEFEAAIALEDDQEAFYYNLGLSYYNLRLYERAAEQYKKAIELNESFGEAWYNLSLALNKIGEPSEAYMAYETYQQLNRSQKSVKHNRETSPQTRGKPKVLAGPNMKRHRGNNFLNVDLSSGLS